MKRILLITTSYPDEAFNKGQEAAGSFVADFAIALSKHVEVTVVAPSNKSSIFQNGGLTIQRFSVPSLPLSLLQFQNPIDWPKIIKTLRAGRQKVLEVVEKTDIDHIFALWALPSGYWAYKASQKFDVPYSIWALGSDIWSLGQIPLINKVLRNVLCNSTYCFADGYLLAEDVEKISERDCQFLPSSRKLTINHEKKLAKRPPYKLAFLGRWHTNKGIDLLLEGLQLLNDHHWAYIDEIKICGGGPFEQKVKMIVAQFQKQGRNIRQLGYLDPIKATDLLLWADYQLIPSRIESIPVIFSDALQCKTPIISSPVGDIPRLMEDYSIGILADEISPLGFKKAIEFALIRPPSLYEEGLIDAMNMFDVDQAASRFLFELRK